MMITVPVGRAFTLDPAFDGGLGVPGVYALPAGSFAYFVDNNDTVYVSDDGTSTFVLPPNASFIDAPFIWGAGVPVTITLHRTGLKKK